MHASMRRDHSDTATDTHAHVRTYERTLTTHCWAWAQSTYSGTRGLEAVSLATFHTAISSPFLVSSPVNLYQGKKVVACSVSYRRREESSHQLKAAESPASKSPAPMHACLHSAQCSPIGVCHCIYISNGSSNSLAACGVPIHTIASNPFAGLVLSPVCC